MRTFLFLTGATAAMLSLWASPSRAQILLRDDFEGTALDATKWLVGSWPLGRTRLGHTPEVAQGLVRLKFDTFDPKEPGRGFLGTELDSRQTFSLETGVEFEVRARVNVLPPGLVGAFFTYKGRDENNARLSDEIDFEFLSNQITKPQVSAPATPPPGGTAIQLTTYRDFNNTRPDYEDKTQINGANVRVEKLNVANFNTYAIRWLPERVTWLVNGEVVRVATTAVPTGAMNICLNLWAPQPSWVEAFSASLVPAQSARSNRSWTLDVDWVEVRRIGGPAETGEVAR